MTLVAQNVKILLEKEKRTVSGSALVTLSDTKQGYAVPRGRQRCLEYGQCNINNCIFCSCLFYLSLLRTQFFQPDMILSTAFSLRILSVQNWLPDHTDNINLEKIVFDDQNFENGRGLDWDKPVPGL